MNTVTEIHPNEIDGDENLSPWLLAPPPVAGRSGSGLRPGIYWSWACRKLASVPRAPLEDPVAGEPRPGDLALVRVEKIGFHKHITTTENRRLRLYPAAEFFGVFGNRYASDAYEAEVQGPDNLSLLTDAGMIGTVKSKHDTMAEPTRILLVGFVRDADGTRLNLKTRLFHPAPVPRCPRKLIYIVGTSMNSGKTTTAALLIKGLSELGLKVAACKLTGSVSNHDSDELAAAAACRVMDFSDFGFPSTYLCPKNELLELFRAMLAEVSEGEPDVVIMELADGLLQRETAMLLAEPEIKRAGNGLVFTAESPLSAIWGTGRLRQMGYSVVAVSGKFTSSPLAMREYCQSDSPVPVVSSAGSGTDLATRVRDFLGNH